MTQVVIANPVINSPFDEPARHFRFSDEGITNEVVEERRISSYFVPIARPKKKKGGAQPALFDTERTEERIKENELVNDIRRRVAMWRKGGYVGVKKNIIVINDEAHHCYRRKTRWKGGNAYRR